MKAYVQITPAEKLHLLKEDCKALAWKSLKEKKWCLHCQVQFSGESVRVYKDDYSGLLLECGNAGCDGAPIHWADYPWWDENHPETKRREALEESGDPELN